MPRILPRPRTGRLVWAAVVLSASPLLAQAEDPGRPIFGRPAGQVARPSGTAHRPVEVPVAMPHGPAAVPPLDNGRSRSPFLRSLDHDTPNLTPRPAMSGPDLYRAQPDTYGARPNQVMPRQRHRRDGAGRPGVSGAYGVMPYYGWPAGVVVGAWQAQAPAQPAVPADGYLRLRVSPRSAEVFVDGAYAGTADEFGGVSERALPAGTHRVELRAAGFEPAEVTVRVPANDTLTYRHELTPSDGPRGIVAEVPVMLPPPPHKTIYIVPGCYAGDTPPQPGELPARCDLADLRIIR